MRPDLVVLAIKAHQLYAPGCECKLTGEVSWPPVVKCARKVLLHQAELVLDRLAALGYTNSEIAGALKCDPSVTCRMHGGGADLQLGLSKILELTQSLERILDGARQQRFNLSVNSSPDIVQPFDFCSRTATLELQESAAGAVYENIRSILLSRPLKERKPLPDGIEGLIASLGDPLYQVFVIQIEPTNELERLKRLLHEIKHEEERLQDRIRRLEKAEPRPRPPRAKFS